MSELLAFGSGIILVRILFILLGALIGGWLLTFFVHRSLFVFSKMNKRREHEKRLQTVAGVLVHTGSFAIGMIAFIMILKEVKIDTSPILASAGLAGLAISFGAQQLIKDVFAGFCILTENQFCEGDAVKLDDLSGVVEKITLRKTILRDQSGNQHHIPHGQVRIVTLLTEPSAKRGM